MSTPQKLQPIEGEVVHDSLFRIFKLFLLALVLIPVGGALVWAWWTDFALGDRRVSWWGAGLGAFLFLAGILGVPVSIVMAFLRTRLIIGQRCFQVVVGKERVTHQLPYKNIARFEFIQDPNGNFIGIDLDDIQDADTLNPDSETNKKWSGWHYKLTDENWSEPMPKIYERIAKRLPVPKTQ
jgi:hypothetical protein